MSKKDPTEDVMAAIARIVETPANKRMPPAPEPPAPPAASRASTTESEDGAQPLGAHGYSRLGPGPLAALRFKWTARRDASGDYYVDETIGDYSRPIVTGPMSGEDAIALVDKRVKDARERFDKLKGDMSVRAPAADLEPDGSGDTKPNA